MVTWVMSAPSAAWFSSPSDRFGHSSASSMPMVWSAPVSHQGTFQQMILAQRNQSIHLVSVVPSEVQWVGCCVVGWVVFGCSTKHHFHQKGRPAFLEVPSRFSGQSSPPDLSAANYPSRVGCRLPAQRRRTGRLGRAPFAIFLYTLLPRTVFVRLQTLNNHLA